VSTNPVSRVEVEYFDGRPPAVVEVTQYAFGELAKWARRNGMAGLSPESAEGMAETMLCMRVLCWAEQTRGVTPPVDFDTWNVAVKALDYLESVEVDPTQPAT
jgi:hypothetical protein